jgi:hypothetical protein
MFFFLKPLRAVEFLCNSRQTHAAIDDDALLTPPPPSHTRTHIYTQAHGIYTISFECFDFQSLLSETPCRCVNITKIKWTRAPCYIDHLSDTLVERVVATWVCRRVSRNTGKIFSVLHSVNDTCIGYTVKSYKMWRHSKLLDLGNLCVNAPEPVLLQKLTVIQLVRKISVRGPGSSLPCLQQPDSGPYSRDDWIQTTFLSTLKFAFVAHFHLLLGLPRLISIFGLSQ